MHQTAKILLLVVIGVIIVGGVSYLGYTYANLPVPANNTTTTTTTTTTVPPASAPVFTVSIPNNDYMPGYMNAQAATNLHTTKISATQYSLTFSAIKSTEDWNYVLNSVPTVNYNFGPCRVSDKEIVWYGNLLIPSYLNNGAQFEHIDQHQGIDIKCTEVIASISMTSMSIVNSNTISFTMLVTLS
jgi:hypothetical protein